MPHLGPLPTLSFALGVATSLFSVLNPISAAAIFASATAGMEEVALRRSARKAALTAGAAMLAFALVGQFMFSLFGFTALAMRFVGGVLVLYRAIAMLYGEDPRERSTEDEKAEASRKLPDARGPARAHRPAGSPRDDTDPRALGCVARAVGEKALDARGDGQVLTQALAALLLAHGGARGHPGARVEIDAPDHRGQAGHADTDRGLTVGVDDRCLAECA